MKLVVQIPCLDEAPRVAEVLRSIPRTLDGIDAVEVLIIDDGSTDGTAEVAMSAGANHLVRFPRRRGLAAAFQAGIRESLRVGADLVVNTDADGQYDPASIQDLVDPILEGRADVVIGDRRPHRNTEFSWVKRRLQRLGSRVVSAAGATGAKDAASGFRAFSREAAMDLVVVSRYTYTVESTLQAGLGPLHVEWVPVLTRPSTRESRLISSLATYIRRNSLTILRSVAVYRPLRFFGILSALLMASALAAFTPFLMSWLLDGSTEGHLQSMLVGSVLAISSVQMLAIGVLADLIGIAREVSHRALVEVRSFALGPGLAEAERRVTD